ncbi:GGDEF domain-containing protein [Coralliovum pocilloporae]|uniref:GGDEF domain-containing protein n=1 Tax=Coralliovum pocilloporae TaxID=3066369 RepID=UPI0033075185
MKRVFARAVLVTVLSVGVSLGITTILMYLVHGSMNRVAFIVAIFVPLFVAFPVSYFVEFQRNRANDALQELALAHQKLRDMYGELSTRAKLDALTGIMNREYFLVALTNRFDEGRHGTLLVLDADRFKAINDTFGHPVGDRALKALVEAVRSLLDEDCLFGRLGGEEFVIFIPHKEGRSASELAESCRGHVEQCEFALDNGDAKSLTISIGAARTDHALTVHDVINEADRNMYRAKQNGRNRVVMDRPSLELVAG